ncbi:hypothetical protein GCM10023334_065510 [Nonomuraea thailandensis]
MPGEAGRGEQDDGREHRREVVDLPALQSDALLGGQEVRRRQVGDHRQGDDRQHGADGGERQVEGHVAGEERGVHAGERAAGRGDDEQHGSVHAPIPSETVSNGALLTTMERIKARCLNPGDSMANW